MTTYIPEVDDDLGEMMRAVFAKYRDRSHSSSLDRQLWTELSELGLTRLTESEATGGSGASWYEGAELLSAAAAQAIRVPFAEHDLMAGSLLNEMSLPIDSRIRTVALVDQSGRSDDVPWASTAEVIVTVWQRDSEYFAAVVESESLKELVSGANAIGEPRDRITVDLSAVAAIRVSENLVNRLRLKGALARSIQVCAALDRALELSVEHAASRKQFGRPLAKFQAVQSLIADAAGECALARAATEAALDAAVNSGWNAQHLEFLIAVARSCTGHAAGTVVRNAHQVHGAIGTTAEHSLHAFTRAALVWRSEFGSVKYWDRRVAEAARTVGGAGLWSLIAD